ncbi:nitroreductase family protein [Undibacterium sp. RuRC25W]|uniref:nitroreductase family protein n=1 Tax=Undibacterium sp. RuRC25W TaxID=3413047 RepID=UPI003BF134C6
MHNIPVKQGNTENLSVIEAIYQRRAVRSYTDEKLTKERILQLLDAAVQAPTAMHEEPWQFMVIQDLSVLRRISEAAKKAFAEAPVKPILSGSTLHQRFTSTDFSIFYNAPTLIIICAKPVGTYAEADCWLAAENLMLAAGAYGLATCVIGFALPVLNTSEWKKELGLATDSHVVVPIIIGVPSESTAPVARKKAEILGWK